MADLRPWIDGVDDSWRYELRGREVWIHADRHCFRLATIAEHLTVDEWLWLMDPEATAERG